MPRHSAAVPRTAPRCRDAVRTLLVLLAFSLLPTALPARAHQAQGPEPASHQHSGTAGAGVGVDEKLGATIPLDLTFRDEMGKPVTLRQLVTVPTIILPVYYHCTDVCSFLQGGLADALPKVRLTPGKSFRVLSISFDDRETPKDALGSKKLFMDAMGGRFPEDDWRFLTGDPAAIARFTAAIGYRFQRRGADFVHPVVSVIVSPQGKIVRYLYGTSFLPMDLTLGFVEASEGRIGPTIRTVASYCFSYDPKNRRYVFNIFRVSATVILLTAGGFLGYLILSGRKKRP